MIPMMQPNPSNVGLIFNLPLADAGSGVVNTTPASSSGSGTPTFTRATTAYTTLSSGLLAEVASGSPRSNYSAAGVYLGYLAEGARTNLCLQSQTLGTTWSPIQVSINANTTVAPDGTTTMDTITNDANAGAHYIYQAGLLVDDTTQTLSLYAKAGTLNYISLTLMNATTAQNFVTKVFDLSLGALGETKLGTTSGTLTDATITAVGGGIYRITLTGKVTLGADNSYIAVSPATAATGNAFDTYGTPTYTSNGTTVIAYGAQLETAAFASSYIPTTTVAVTRNADVLTYASAGNISGTVGSVYAEVAGANVVTGNYFIGNDSAAIYLDASKITLYDGTGNRNGNAFSASATVQKMAVSWGGAAAQTALSGTTSASLSFDGDMGWAATFGVGISNSGGAPLNGTIRNVRIYSVALSASRLQSMTS